jgi:hypothetical protein
VEHIKDKLIRLRQSRYLIDQDKKGQGDRSPYDYKWDVYLTYITNTHPNEPKSKWFASNQEFAEISVPSGKEGRHVPLIFKMF